MLLKHLDQQDEVHMKLFLKGSSRILAGCLSGLSRDLLAYDFLKEVNSIFAL